MSSSDETYHPNRKPRRKAKKRNSKMKTPPSKEKVELDFDPAIPSTSGYIPPPKKKRIPFELPTFDDSDLDEDYRSAPSPSTPSSANGKSSGRRKGRPSCYTLPASLLRKQMGTSKMGESIASTSKGASSSAFHDDDDDEEYEDEEIMKRHERWANKAKEAKLKRRHFKPYMSLRDNDLLNGFLQKKKNDPAFLKSLYEKAAKSPGIKVFSDDESVLKGTSLTRLKDTNQSNRKDTNESNVKDTNDSCVKDTNESSVKDANESSVKDTTNRSGPDCIVFDKRVDGMFKDYSDSDEEFENWCNDTKGKITRGSWQGGPLPDECLGWNYDGLLDSPDNLSPGISDTERYPAFLNPKYNQERRSKKISHPKDTERASCSKSSAKSFAKVSKKRKTPVKRKPPSDGSDSDSEPVAHPPIKQRKITKKRKPASNKEVHEAERQLRALFGLGTPKHDSSPENEESVSKDPKTDADYINEVLGGRMVKVMVSKLPNSVSSTVPLCDPVVSKMEGENGEQSVLDENDEQSNCLPQEEDSDSQVVKAVLKKFPCKKS